MMSWLQMKAQIQTLRTLTETLFSTWSSSLNSLVNTFITFWITIYIFARHVRICAETSDQEGEPSCEEPSRTHKPHSFLPAWKVSIQSFPHSSTIYQSTISCLSTSDQNWVHFSLLAALTILIMQPARLQHLPQQTERSVDIVFVLLLLHIFTDNLNIALIKIILGIQCSKRCWRWAVSSFGGT